VKVVYLLFYFQIISQHNQYNLLVAFNTAIFLHGHFAAFFANKAVKAVFLGSRLIIKTPVKPLRAFRWCVHYAINQRVNHFGRLSACRLAQHT
jgi:hypothetical protein